MTWRRALLLDLATAGVAVAVTVFVARPWRRHVTEMRWPAVPATVTGLVQGPGFKGRSFTYLRGEYELDGGRQGFSVVWGPSDFRDKAWVAPSGTPSVGSHLLVHANPDRRSEVALEAGPRVPTAAGTFFRLALLLLVLAGWAVAVWFI